MTDWFVSEFESILPIIVSAICIYIALIVFTRIAGKRSFSKMSSFDFAITISIGSVLAATILNKSVSLIQGVVGLGILYTLQLIIAHLRQHKHIHKLIDNEPLLLMKGVKFFRDNMKKAKVTESDIRGKLREANVLKLNQVRAVIFESTGDISVLHTTDPEIEVEDYLLKDVDQ